MLNQVSREFLVNSRSIIIWELILEDVVHSQLQAIRSSVYWPETAIRTMRLTYTSSYVTLDLRFVSLQRRYKS